MATEMDAGVPTLKETVDVDPVAAATAQYPPAFLDYAEKRFENAKLELTGSQRVKFMADIWNHLPPESRKNFQDGAVPPPVTEFVAELVPTPTDQTPIWAFAKGAKEWRRVSINHGRPGVMDTVEGTEIFKALRRNTYHVGYDETPPDCVPRKDHPVYDRFLWNPMRKERKKRKGDRRGRPRSDMVHKPGEAHGITLSISDANIQPLPMNGTDQTDLSAATAVAAAALAGSENGKHPEIRAPTWAFAKRAGEWRPVSRNHGRFGIMDTVDGREVWKNLRKGYHVGYEQKPPEIFPRKDHPGSEPYLFKQIGKATSRPQNTKTSKTTKRCHNCHRSININSLTCFYCRATLPRESLPKKRRARAAPGTSQTTKRCHNCHRSVNINSLTCFYCRAALPRSSLPPRPAKKKLRKNAPKPVGTAAGTVAAVQEAVKIRQQHNLNPQALAEVVSTNKKFQVGTVVLLTGIPFDHPYSHLTGPYHASPSAAGQRAMFLNERGSVLHCTQNGCWALSESLEQMKDNKFVLRTNDHIEDPTDPSVRWKYADLQKDQWVELGSIRLMISQVTDNEPPVITAAEPLPTKKTTPNVVTTV